MGFMIRGLLLETWNLLREMAPYLLLGFTVAGLLRVIIPDAVVVKYLSGKKWKSVVNASLIGVPLPLCSCGVIPVTAYLKKMGVKRGAILSFLTSTPTTGVDSILATYSLMGGLFTFLRVASSFTIGIFSGIMANIFSSKEDELQETQKSEPIKCEFHAAQESFEGTVWFKVKRVFSYACVDLIDDVGKWLVIGIVAGGLISYFVPTEIVTKYLGNPVISYALMLAIGIPMHVCSTGSIPIAASLIMKGMSPGAGLVFLIAGPATNTATISFVGGKFGFKTLFIYLSSIILGSVVWGALLDLLWPNFGMQINLMLHNMSQPGLLGFDIKTISAIILCSLLLKSFGYKIFRKKSKCPHCD